MPIPQGTKLGRYQIHSLLGAGGMGEVYLADDLTLHRKVAVKVLRADVIGNNDRRRRFELEAIAASSLNHPNILTIYEVGHENQHHFMVSEFIDGESLTQRLAREPLKLLEVLDVGIQVASALGAAHAAGIVHRDIKPDNIMLRHDRLVKVLDFGLAKLIEPDFLDPEMLSKALQVTVPGVVLGTARYMSPEQARGLPIDARTDIWSLGVVLYRMVVGTLPFNGKTMSDVIAAILTSDPPALATYGLGVPSELDRIVTTSLRKNVEDRYQSVKSLELDLQTLKQRLGFEAELERVNSKDHDSGSEQAATDPRKATRTKQLVGPGINSELTQIRLPSGAGYTASKWNRDKLSAALVLTLIIAAISALAYFGFTHKWGTNSGAGITSLAVLPFTNAGNDPEKEYLSNGISESLINRLSQLPGVKVIANSSSSRYKSGDSDPEEVATALDVGAVLTGKVLQRGNDLLISVELINGRDRTQLWGQQYNRKAIDLLTVQAEISREIAEALRLRLTPGQRQRLVTSGMVKPEAYELLLKGRFHSGRGTTDDRKKAADYFNQSIAADPGYALAYAELADIYRSLVNSGVLDPKEYLSKAQAAAQKSIELDQSLSEGHYALANLKTYAWQWADAESEYKRAIELNPNLALVHRWYASYLRLRGKSDQAVAEIKRARELDPLSPGVNATVGYLLFGARQYDQAIEVLKQTVALDKTYPYAHLFLGFTYTEKGMYAEAIAAYQEAIKLGLNTPSTQIHLGVTYARAGNPEQAQAILKHLQTSTDHVSTAELAMLYTAMGEREQALSSLEKAYDEHDLQLQYLGVSPEFDPLRSDPRFQNLLHRIGLTS